MSRYVGIGIIALVIIALDQWTKILTVQHLELGQAVTVIDNFFDLVHVRNRGAAFGFLNNPDTTWQLWFFGIISIISSFVIIFIAKLAQAGERLLFVGLGLVLGGAIGNLIDRVYHGSVVDFLDFYYANWHWPAFNVADIAICCGAFLSLLAIMKQDIAEFKKKKA